MISCVLLVAWDPPLVEALQLHTLFLGAAEFTCMACIGMAALLQYLTSVYIHLLEGWEQGCFLLEPLYRLQAQEEVWSA
jgi:hypothetical protein